MRLLRALRGWLVGQPPSKPRIRRSSPGSWTCAGTGRDGQLYTGWGGRPIDAYQDWLALVGGA